MGHLDKMFTGKLRFRGFFRLYTTNERGEITKDTGIFPNLITNGGLDFVGTCPTAGIAYGVQDFTAMCAVGVGNATPAYTDVTLQSWLAAVYDSSGNGCSVNTSYNAGPPAYWQGQRSWQFAAGTATGNIAEIGVGPNSSQPPVATDPLFSRALVVDGGGSPTVIPVLANEALTVTYILQEYLDLTDTNYTMSLSGTSYSGIFRRAHVSTVPNLGIGIGSGGRCNCVVYSGSIGPLTGEPTGSQSEANIYVSPVAYVTGSYSSTINFSFDINHGNVGGVNAIKWLSNGSAGQYQLSVTPTIPKTSTYNMTLSCAYSWARYP